MINASEARVLMDEYIRTRSEQELSQTRIRINEHIKKSVKRSNLTRFDLPVELTFEHRDLIVNELEAAGYNVKLKFIHGYIPQLEINWLEVNNG